MSKEKDLHIGIHSLTELLYSFFVCFLVDYHMILQFALELEYVNNHITSPNQNKQIINKFPKKFFVKRS